ncbi:hypothetical protein HanRHA438_Chr10g0457271 [Helianthus annuus]|nr:hypothetical protein HanRHA438_Chr10g0457271 [Helianthus annuus]
MYLASTCPTVTLQFQHFDKHQIRDQTYRSGCGQDRYNCRSPLRPLPDLLQISLLLYLRDWSSQHVHNLQRTQKKMHLLLPSSEVHTFELLQFVLLDYHILHRSACHLHRN